MHSKDQDYQEDDREFNKWSLVQNCMSGRALRIGFGLKVDKISSLIRAW